MIVSVTIPQRGLANASYEVRQKPRHDWPLVQAAVAFRGGRNGANAANVKIVLGHVAPTPIDATAAARAVEGRAITDETATAAGRAAVQGARALRQNEYKVRLAEVAVKRALLMAAGARRYWETAEVRQREE
jgi:xanthine dehydrogenase YagS FAD-binding subunit